jgi:hypothetical protein
MGVSEGLDDMETKEMTAHEPTIANADLWTKYFRDQWSPWLGQGSAESAAVAAGTAARVASFLTLVAAGPIAWLYSSNEPEATSVRTLVPAQGAWAADEMESIEEPAA